MSVSRCCYALAVSLSATILGSCGAQSQPNSFAALPQIGSTPKPQQREASWMSPAAPSIKELLYISDESTNDVFVYNYSTGARVGTVKGFDYPLGQCVDATGDVWIANYYGTSVEEFAHGGKTALATVTTDGNPVGCSIDPKTGDLAVASEPGVLQTWHAGKAVGKYSNGDCAFLLGPGYDDKGNVYAACFVTLSAVHVAEVPAGGKSLKVISFNQTLFSPGDAMWDGKYITFADTEFEDNGVTAIYRAKPTSGGLSLVSTTVLTDNCAKSNDYDGTPQPFIVGTKNTPVNNRQGKLVVGGNEDCTPQPFDTWAYPAGGNPTSKLAKAPSVPAGEAVSIATK